VVADGVEISAGAVRRRRGSDVARLEMPGTPAFPSGPSRASHDRLRDRGHRAPPTLVDATITRRERLLSARRRHYALGDYGGARLGHDAERRRV